MLSCHTSTYLSLSSGLFQRGFPTKIVYEFFISTIITKCSAHRNLLDYTILTLGYLYNPRSFSMCNTLSFGIASSFLGPDRKPTVPESGLLEIRFFPSGNLSMFGFEIRYKYLLEGFGFIDCFSEINVAKNQGNRWLPRVP
jgi:hypothetical protein